MNFRSSPIKWNTLIVIPYTCVKDALNSIPNDFTFLLADVIKVAYRRKFNELSNVVR